MKAFKKVLSLALCATMFTSAFALAGCDNPGSSKTGAVAGKYVELTAENEKPVKDFLQKAADKMAETDPTADDFNVGLAMDSDLYFQMKQPATEYSMGQEVTLDFDLSAKFAISKAAETATNSLNGLDLKAALDLGLNANTKMTFGGQTQKTNVNVNADLFMDNVGTYVGAAVKMSDGSQSQAQSQYMKINTLELLAYVGESMGSILPGFGGEAIMPMADTIVEDSEIDLETIIASLEELGLKTYFDLNNNGLKLKLSFTEEIFLNLIADSEETPEDLNVKAFKLDAYLVFDKDGNFGLVSLDANVNIAVAGGSVVLKGYFSIEIGSSVKVTLPGNLATDPKYIEMSVEDLLG
jgi:hypothetical protein